MLTAVARSPKKVRFSHASPHPVAVTSPPRVFEEAAEAPNREVMIALIDLHARAVLRMPWVQLALVAGFGLLVLPNVGVGRFALWGAATLGIELLRAAYSAAVLRRGLDIDPRRCHLRFTLLAGVSGSALGAGGYWFLPSLPPEGQAVLGAALFAIPSAGVAVAQSSRYMVALYAIGVLGPSAVRWGMLHPSQSLGVIALTALYCAVMTLVAADGEKLLLRSVRIRHERDRLVLDLEQRNADVQKAMAEVERLAQTRSRVLAAASHDLRQPLHALSVYSAVLAANPPAHALQELSRNIDQIVRSLGDLLNGLLDLSRLSAGFYVPERTAVALELVVAEVCAQYRQAAEQKGLRLLEDLAPIRLMGDAVAIGRIARNLIDNAIKYTDAGTVTVSTRLDSTPAEPLAVLSVADTGKGIPPAEHTRIFEEFHQLDNPGRDRSKGVGLGLAIVQRLCELTGATVSIESAEGSGTLFRVAMPALRSTPARPQIEVAAASEVSLRGRRVYVVDDELDIRRSMQAVLELWGLSVAIADSPHAASKLFAETGPPDLMIVDLRLGAGQHGAGLADELQRIHGAFPVLIMTGETSSEALRAANERRYTLLQKPIPAEVLRRAIAQVI